YVPIAAPEPQTSGVRRGNADVVGSRAVDAELQRNWSGSLAQFAQIDHRMAVAHRVGAGQANARGRQNVDPENDVGSAKRPEARVLSLKGHVLREYPSLTDRVGIRDQLVEDGTALVRSKGDVSL